MFSGEENVFASASSITNEPFRKKKKKNHGSRTALPVHRMLIPMLRKLESSRSPHIVLPSKTWQTFWLREWIAKRFATIQILFLSMHRSALLWVFFNASRP